MAKWANSDEEDDDDNDEGAADERASQSGAPFVYLYGPVSRHVTPEIYEVNIVVPVRYLNKTAPEPTVQSCNIQTGRTTKRSE